MNSRRKKNMKKNITAWLLVAPALIFMLLFTVYPIIRSVYLSLSEYKLGMSEPLFVGADNYIRLFRSDTFWKVMRNTIVFALMTVLPSMGMGLMLAMLVNRKTRGVGFIRTAYFYPAIMPMIAIASVWLFIYMAKNGLFDQLLTRFNISPMNVLSNKNTVLPAMAVMYVWKEAGYLMVFFLSGVQSISEDIIEAAKIDGANKIMVFRKIIMPLLAPTFLFVSTIAFTNSFKLVDHVVVMTEGAPNNASTLLLYYIYQQGFTNFNYGVSSALTVIMLVLLLVFSLPRFFNQDKKIHYN
jgi:ABC-type sugar transport systems, permease components